MLRFLAVSSLVTLIPFFASCGSTLSKDGMSQVSIPREALGENGCPKKDSLFLSENGIYYKVDKIRKNENGTCEIFMNPLQ